MPTCPDNWTYRDGLGCVLDAAHIDPNAMHTVIEGEIWNARLNSAVSYDPIDRAGNDPAHTLVQITTRNGIVSYDPTVRVGQVLTFSDWLDRVQRLYPTAGSMASTGYTDLAPWAAGTAAGTGAGTGAGTAGDSPASSSASATNSATPQPGNSGNSLPGFSNTTLLIAAGVAALFFFSKGK